MVSTIGAELDRDDAIDASGPDHSAKRNLPGRLDRMGCQLDRGFLLVGPHDEACHHS